MTTKSEKAGCHFSQKLYSEVGYGIYYFRYKLNYRIGKICVFLVKNLMVFLVTSFSRSRHLAAGLTWTESRLTPLSAARLLKHISEEREPTFKNRFLYDHRKGLLDIHKRIISHYFFTCLCHIWYRDAL